MSSPPRSCLAIGIASTMGKRAGFHIPAVMPALVAGIHAGPPAPGQRAWMAGTSPAMTSGGVVLHAWPGLVAARR
ncbi:hypothetical protein GGR16_000231 [Chelatococcus caeni]|uniref:Uncharacterized protein n=1 Tax=Chelatococcus caeni TaxID=1348468 RepID=A0A840BPJ1_9HYPH|nr:hypothetical protein [Chelatococcus caeni]